MDLRTKKFLQYIGREKVNQNKIKKIIKLQEELDNLNNYSKANNIIKGMSKEKIEEIQHKRKRNEKELEQLKQDIDKEYSGFIKTAIKNKTIKPPQEDNFIRAIKQRKK